MAASSSSSSAYQHPPAVRFPVARSAGAALALAGLSAVGASVLAGWSVAGAPANRLPLVLAWLLWMLTAGCAARAWWRSPVGSLQWDGAQWWFAAAQQAQALAAEAAPQVHLDLQRFLLLSLPLHGGRKLWLCLERHRSPAEWIALRRAVYSRARTAGVAAAANPAVDS